MRLPALLCAVLGYAAAFPSPLWQGAATQPEILDQDMHKLNEYLQAEKVTSTNSAPAQKKRVALPEKRVTKLGSLTPPVWYVLPNSGELVR